MTVILTKSQFPWGQHGNFEDREIRNQIVASGGGCPLHEPKLSQKLWGQVCDPQQSLLLVLGLLKSISSFHLP